MNKNIALPEDVYSKVVELADKDRVSIEEFVASALSDQLAARRYLEARAQRADRERFSQALEQVPDVDPEPYDRL